MKKKKERSYLNRIKYTNLSDKYIIIKIEFISF